MCVWFYFTNECVCSYVLIEVSWLKLGEEMHGVWSLGPKPRGRPKRTWRDVVEEDCQARKLNKEDAVDRCKWRKMIKDVRWSGWVWVGECFFWYRPTRVVPDKRPLNGCVRACVRACVCCCCWLKLTIYFLLFLCFFAFYIPVYLADFATCIKLPLLASH